MINDRLKHNELFDAALKNLNEAQLEAVNHIDGPVLVIAGPGTGKTQILSARIGNILKETDTQPNNILCLTYTDAGTIAMRKRLLEFIGPEAYNVHIYTFHAFCNQVIQENLEHFGVRDLQPISDLETIDVFQELIDGFGPEHPLRRFTGERYFEIGRLNSLFETMKRENWSPKFIVNKVDEYLKDLPTRDAFIYKRANKSKGIKAGDPNMRLIEAETGKMEKLKAAALEFDRYEQLMQKNRRYDYNDMILWVLEAFQENDDLLQRYQEQYFYFLVDEYQDTNGAQNEILRMLSDFWDAPNVFVVGDDDQSIFRFQGANVKNIADFYRHHKPELKTIVLEKNYRSSQQILDISKTLIQHNSERLVNLSDFKLNKNLQAGGENAAYTTEPSIIEYFNTAHEDAGIIKKIEALQQQGVALSEVAVIYRSHSQVNNIVHILEQKNIPLNVKQRINILELPLIQNLIRLLTYVQKEYDEPDSAEYLLFEIMHYDFFNISARDAAKISKACHRKKDGEKPSWRELIASKERMFALGLETASAISSLEANLTYWTQQLRNMTVQVLFGKVLTKGNVLEHIMHSDDKVWLMQVITTFFNFIKEESAKNPRLTLKELLEMLDKMGRNNIPINLNKILHSEEGVNFITSHSSKGLEFDYVFLIGCTADKWEKKRGGGGGFHLPDTVISSVPENKDEEERRLFFVAITRAKKHLEISYSAENESGKPLEKSRFVAEILDGSLLEAKGEHLSDDAIIEYHASIMHSAKSPTLDYIDHDLVDSVVNNFKMSVTSLNKYLRCPITFYFENILKVPQARNVHMGFGNAVHYALENFFREMTQSSGQQFPEKGQLLTYFEKGMELFRSHFTEQEYQDRIDFANQLLPEYYDLYVNQWNKIAVLEYDINNVHVGGVPISGKLDKLEFNGQEVNVVDYKTGKPENGKTKLRGPNDKNPKGEDYWRQIVFYKILVDNDKRKPWKMVSGEMDFIQKDQKGGFVKEKVVVSPEEVAFVTEQITESYRNIKAHNFSTGCGEDNCQWCTFVKNNYQSENISLVFDDED